MRNKLGSLLLTITLLLGAGCSGLPNPQTSETDNAASSSNTTETKEKEGTNAGDIEPQELPLPLMIEAEDLQDASIQLWHPWTGETARMLETLTGDFNRMNPYEIEVTVEGQGNELFGAVSEGVNSGRYPDLVFGTSFDLISWQDTRDVFVDLEPYIRDPTFGLSEGEISDFESLLWEQTRSSGKRLGVPGLAVTTLLVYNESWGKELGFDGPPNTPAAFRDQACAAAAASIDGQAFPGSGGFIMRNDPATLMSWILAFGGTMSADPGEDFQFNSPAGFDAFDYVKALFKAGCAWIPEAVYAEEEFAARGGLIYATTIDALPYIAEAFARSGSSDSWTVLTYPREDGQGIINVWSYSFAILEATPEAEAAAWLLVKWLVSPQNQAKIAEASSTIPSRMSAMAFLEAYGKDLPQWAAAQVLMPNGVGEPRLPSWTSGRWAVGEAASQMLSADFNSEELPALLETLDELLEDIQMQEQ